MNSVVAMMAPLGHMIRTVAIARGEVVDASPEVNGIVDDLSRDDARRASRHPDMPVRGR